LRRSASRRLLITGTQILLITAKSGSDILFCMPNRTERILSVSVMSALRPPCTAVVFIRALCVVRCTLQVLASPYAGIEVTGSVFQRGPHSHASARNCLVAQRGQAARTLEPSFSGVGSKCANVGGRLCWGACELLFCVWQGVQFHLESTKKPKKMSELLFCVLQGVQFHPESIITTNGIRIVQNFVDSL
jgi:hypothetical protein